MAVDHGFWDSVAGDRTVDSADFAEALAALTADGYILGKDDELAVVQTSPVTKDVQVGRGFAFVQGRWLRIFSAAQPVTVAVASAADPRIDRVCVRVDYTARTVAVAYKQGTPAGAPTPPTLTQTAGVTWEHPLAQLVVPANATQIFTDQGDAGASQGYVVDERTWAAGNPVMPWGRFFKTGNINFGDSSKSVVSMGGTAENNGIGTLAGGNAGVVMAVEGLVHVDAHIAWTANANGWRRLYLVKNGNASPVATTTDWPATSGATATQSLSYPVPVVPGDVISVEAQQTSGVTLQVLGSATHDGVNTSKMALRLAAK